MTTKGSAKRATKAKNSQAQPTIATRLRFVRHVIRQKTRYCRKSYRAEVSLDYHERILRKSFKRAQDARTYAERVSARIVAFAT